jgi:hypothetical protein
MPSSVNEPATSAVATLISNEHAAFLVPGVSVIAASRDSRLIPSVSRGVACRVSEDRRNLTILLRRMPAAAVIRDVAASGWITTCHSLPSTHRTIQLKGRDAVIGSPRPEDVALAHAFVDGFIAELEPIGYTKAFVRTMLSFAPEDLVAVRFTPTEIYSQTPGPNAGQRVA